MKYVITLLTIFLSQAELFLINAQDPVMVNFTMDDGLLSNQIHDLCIGPNGRLYIASDNGLSVYDGTDFKHLTYDDGFDDISIIEIFKDEKERLWFVSLSGRIFYIKNDIVKPYRYNQDIINFKKGNPYPIIDFYADSNNNISLSFNLSGLLKIDSSGKLIKNCTEYTNKYKTQFIEEVKTNTLSYKALYYKLKY